MNEQRQRSASLGCISLIAVFFVALAALGLAYQAKPTYLVDIGARTDKPFVSGFNDREPPFDTQKSTDQTYRWTRTNSYVNLPGVGSQDITVTLNVTASANPNHQLTVWANSHQIPLTQTVLSGNSYSQISFAVPGDWFGDGNLQLHFLSQTFNPPGDARNLGAVLDWVKVEPHQTSFLPFVRPPTDSFLPLLLIAVLSVLIFFSIGVPTPFSLLGGLGIIGSLCYWLINDRLSLTVLLQQNFTESLFFIWLAVWAAAEFGPRLYKLFGVAVTRRESGWLAGLFLLQFGLLYFVMIHPQFASSDVGLDLHNLQRVQQGIYFFQTDLPNGLPQPYPPAYYFFLLPLAALTSNSDAALIDLIQLTNAALQATGVFLIYYLSTMLRQLPRQVTNSDLILREEMEHGWEVGTNWAGLLACAVYVVCRYVYLIFSQGNFTNLFGAWAFLLFVTVTAGTLGYFRAHQGVVLSRWGRFRPSPIVVPPPAITTVTSSGIVHYRRQHRADELQTVAAGVVTATAEELRPDNVVSQSPFATNPATNLQTELKSSRLDKYEDEDKTQPSLSQRFFGRLAAYINRAIWPRLLATLRYLLPLLLLVVVFVSHYGVFLFTNVFMLCAIGVLAVFGGAKGRRDALYLGVIYVLALLIAYFLYYGQFRDIIAQEFSGSFGGTASSTPKKSFDPGIVLKRLYTSARDDFGLSVLFAAAGGIALWLIGWWQAAWPDQSQLPPRWRQRFAIVVLGRVTPLNALLFALFVSGVFFALLSEVIGLESRYQLYLLPLIALAAGALLGRLWRSSFVGVLLVSSLFLFQLLTVITFWLGRLTEYRG